MEDLNSIREKTFAGVDKNLYLHIGYFLTWFSKCELSLTYLMAITSRINKDSPESKPLSASNAETGA